MRPNLPSESELTYLMLQNTNGTCTWGNLWALRLCELDVSIIELSYLYNYPFINNVHLAEREAWFYPR